VGSVVRVYPGPPSFCPDAVAAYGRCAPDGPPNDRRGALLLFGGLWLGLIDPGLWLARVQRIGALAQLGEHLLCKQGVIGSIPISSTISAAFKTACGVVVGGLFALSYREIKVCIGSFEPDACSDYIVKRRYVWKLPGVLRNS
jgi:hypothetical protein